MYQYVEITFKVFQFYMHLLYTFPPRKWWLSSSFWWSLFSFILLCQLLLKTTRVAMDFSLFPAYVHVKTCHSRASIRIMYSLAVSHDLIIQWRWQRFVSLKDKKHGYNRLSCALSDYDSDGDGTVRVPEFLSSVSAGSEGEGIAGLIDQNSKYRTNQSSNGQRHYSRLQISMSSYAVWTTIVILATLVW